MVRFLSLLPENKADLAKFISFYLIANSPDDKVIVVAGGFDDEREARSTCEDVDVSGLCGIHEEADTRLILHCVNNNCNTVVVSARDEPCIPSTNVYMMAGTAKKRKYYNVRAISRSLPLGSLSALLPFHALTSCDTTSYFCNHSKVSAWKEFLKYYNLLLSLGEGDMTEDKITDAE